MPDDSVYTPVYDSTYSATESNPDDGGLDVHNGPDAQTMDGRTANTPDPHGAADINDYVGRGPGVNVAIDYVPPWPQTRAPGTVRTLAPSEIVPRDPWLPGLALLNANQMAMLNRESAARQAASQYVDNWREI